MVCNDSGVWASYHRFLTVSKKRYHSVTALSKTFFSYRLSMNWERTPVFELQVNIYILRLRTVDIQLRLFPVSRVRVVRTCHSYHHQWHSKLGYWGEATYSYICVHIPSKQSISQ